MSAANGFISGRAGLSAMNPCYFVVLRTRFGSIAEIAWILSIGRWAHYGELEETPAQRVVAEMSFSIEGSGLYYFVIACISGAQNAKIVLVER